MRIALERATGRNCDLITDADLADVRNLGIAYDDADNQKKSDFAGLDNVQSLLLGISNGEVAIIRSVLNNMDNLQSLDLWGHDLTELPPGVFDGLSNLQSLNLSDNNLSELPPGVFDGLDNLQTLDLRWNPGAPFRITHPNSGLQGNGWVR